jgi:hypothetical protein
MSMSFLPFIQNLKLIKSLQVPFCHYLADQLSIAFDVYLDILHNVDLHVKNTLAQDAPDYDRKNVCPPCMYKVENELLLKFSMLLLSDGNQSLQLTDSAFLVVMRFSQLKD